MNVKKGLAVAVILLFLSVSVIPSTGIIVFNDDTTPPVTTCTLDPPEPDGDNGWYVNDVNVTLNATDDMSGVKAIYYKIPGGEWKNHTGDFLIFILDYDCLIGRIEFYSVDYAGNQEEAKSVRIDIDQLPPDIGDPVWEAYKEGGTWYVTFIVNATDACSGIDRVEMFINDGFHEEVVGPGPTYELIIEWSPVFKSVTFWFYCYDIAGNVASVSVNGSDIKSYSSSQSSSQQSTGRGLADKINVWCRGPMLLDYLVGNPCVFRLSFNHSHPSEKLNIHLWTNITKLDGTPLKLQYTPDIRNIPNKHTSTIQYYSPKSFREYSGFKFGYFMVNVHFGVKNDNSEKDATFKGFFFYFGSIILDREVK